MGIKIKRSWWRALFAHRTQTPVRRLIRSTTLVGIAAVLAIPVGIWQVLDLSPRAVADTPVISSVTPSSGSVAGGETVTISGSGFTLGQVTQVSSSGTHSCAVAHGKAYCWGSNSDGQLGDGTQTNSSVPVAVDTSGVLADKTVSSVQAGSGHSCALAEGHVYCWGSGASNYLYSGWRENTTTPMEIYMGGVLAGKTITKLALGNNTACVIAAGQAYCWGWNANGQLGNNSTSNSNTPVAVSTSGLLAGKTVTDIDSGQSHTCAVANGSGYCWGQNNYGQLGTGTATGGSPVGGTGNKLTPVAINMSGAFAGHTMVAIQAGSNMACGQADNTVACWGYNNYGQLGNGTTNSSPDPVAITTSGGLAGKTIAALTTGGSTSCVTANSQAYCWGANFTGGVGDGSTNNALNPVAVDTSGVLNGKLVTDLSASANSCAVAAQSVYCWGSNNYGQLGNNSTSTSSVPVATDTSLLRPLPTVTFDTLAATDVAVVDSTTITATTPAHPAGTVDVTVQNPGGETNTYPSSYTYLNAPPAITSITPNTGVGGDSVTITGSNFSGQSATFSVLSTGSTASHSCGVSNDQVYCWGKNDTGQLGNNSTADSLVPVAVDMTGVLNGKTITAIASGYAHTCALDSDGRAYCWGSNSNGQLGNNSTADSHVPVAVDTSGVLSGKSLTKLTIGADFTCGITADGLAYCWGRNDTGQLGNNDTNDSHVPVAVDTSGVLSGKSLTTIASSVYSTCVLDSSGTAYCWGSNSNGQLGTNGVSFSLTPVAVDTSGDLSGKSLTKLASGFAHVCAVSSSNTLYCWGSNSDGQLGNNDTNDSAAPVVVDASGVLNGKTITSITSGGNHTCVLDSDGRAYCWGDNTHGQLGNDSTTSSSVAVAVDMTGVLNGSLLSISAVKNSFTCALDTIGRAYCWGANDSGQLGNDSLTESHVPIVVDTSSIVSRPTVTFDGIAANNIVLVSDTTITATVPAHSAGAVDVTVMNPDGQSDTVVAGYSYQTTATAPTAPTSLTATPADAAVDLAWQAPSSDGGSALTDYLVEYSDDGGGSWQSFAHPASTATAITVTGLSPGITYQFRVSAVNAIGTSSPSDVAASAILSITLSAPGSVGITVTPSGTTTVSSAASTINVTTNNPTGYQLLLAAASGQRNLVSGTGNSLSPTPGTLASPSSLTINTWGFRVDGIGGFGAGPTVQETNVTTSGFSWAGIPEAGSPVAIHNSGAAVTDDPTTVWYAMKIDNSHPAGTYSSDVLYTAIAN